MITCVSAAHRRQQRPVLPLSDGRQPKPRRPFGHLRGGPDARPAAEPALGALTDGLPSRPGPTVAPAAILLYNHSFAFDVPIV
jgi:hypothetical protein